MYQQKQYSELKKLLNRLVECDKIYAKWSPQDLTEIAERAAGWMEAFKPKDDTTHS
jgi:hypothetical protein